MYLELITEENARLYFESFDDCSKTIAIGSAEGYIGNNQQLITVIKVYDGFQKSGVGFELFYRVFEYFSQIQPILTIVGTWSNDSEFSYCEGGESTNLKVFKTLTSDHFTKEEAALNTPTGKWAKKLGYDKVKVLIIREDQVTVEFSQG